ncbi:transcriptional antiterminator, BglG [Coriobacterium glomerans PW2]|uniref:Transcriptional antiterminator, BglG n=1 Tax=Coriobacterium glomerans (strain ATCC 49209 / DSM 20642 / JCM 10262 / PW2) TaxID=700015 RepID=F2N8U7_CORGP|nr:BglG family transcription antiterminator [Coriobacterium glomerans]AEB07547.1 transcriptional antiterminator, BglG [Coriobacterium glomerans PW2]
MRDAEFVRFIRQTKPINPADAAARLHVSARTIRTYVHRANRAMEGFARITLSRESGYAIVEQDSQRIEAWLSDALRSVETSPQTPQERIAYLLNDLLMRTDWITMDSLCDMLYISRSTLTGDLKGVERELNRFDLSLLKRPHRGIRVEGEEMARRVCLANIAVESMSGGDLVHGHLLAVVSRCVENVAHAQRFQIVTTGYQSLLVHIAIALLRIKEGCYVPMASEHLERLRPAREYAVAQMIAEGIEREIGIELPQEEIGYMAIHLAGKQTLLDSQGDAQGIVISDDVWGVVSRMLECIWAAFRFDFRYDLELRMNLARHIVPLAVRLRYSMRLRNPMLPDIRIRYALAFAMAQEASHVLGAAYGSEPSDDEIGYIALAFALALERQKTEVSKKSILMVCASGAGSARLLEFRCRREFADYIDTIATCDVLNLDAVDFSGIDYVFTTVPIERPLPVPVREVSYFLDGQDIVDLRDLLRGDAVNEALHPFFKKSLFFPHMSTGTKEEALDYLIDRVAEREPVHEDFRNLVWRRERLVATSFGNGVAMPHPLEPAAETTIVCIGLLDEPVAWDDSGCDVRAIFLVAFAPDVDDSLKSFLSVFTDILSSARDIDLLVQHQSWKTFADIVASAFASARAPAPTERR